MERSKQGRRSRQISFGLGNGRLEREGIDIIWRDLKNLIKLSQRIGKPAHCNVEKSMLGQERNVPRIESPGLLEISVGAIPLAFPARYVGKRFRNLAAIGKKLTRLLEVTDGRIVIFLAGIVILAFCQNSLAKIRLKRQSRLGCLPCLFPQRSCWLQVEGNISPGIYV